MSKAHVTYDTRTGRILGAHYGATDAAHARQTAQTRSGVEAAHIGVIEVPSDAHERSKYYKVDTRSMTLVETAVGEHGVGFGFGTMGRLDVSK
jgi:hypothetical protein